MAGPDHVEPTRGATDVVGARIVAQLIDLVVLFVQAVAVALALALLVRPVTEDAMNGLVGIGFLTLPLYGGLLEGYWNGQTIGKRIAGIAVVDRRGNAPSVKQAFVRNLPAIVLFSWLTTVVALAAIAIGGHRQRVFDLVANTYVVRA